MTSLEQFIFLYTRRWIQGKNCGIWYNPDKNLFELWIKYEEPNWYCLDQCYMEIQFAYAAFIIKEKNLIADTPDAGSIDFFDTRQQACNQWEMELQDFEKLAIAIINQEPGTLDIVKDVIERGG
jgi:hypothetical protein